MRHGGGPAANGRASTTLLPLVCYLLAVRRQRNDQELALEVPSVARFVLRRIGRASESTPAVGIAFAVVSKLYDTCIVRVIMQLCNFLAQFA